MADHISVAIIVHVEIAEGRSALPRVPPFQSLLRVCVVVRLQLQALAAKLLLVPGSLVYCVLELLAVPIVHVVLVKFGRALLDVCCLLLLALIAVVLQLGFDHYCCERA